MKVRMGFALMALVAWVSAPALACDKGGCTKGTSDPVAKALSRVATEMPKITYKVGEYESSCPHAAQAMAEEKKTAITYVVAGESFTDKAAAQNKLAELWNAQIPEVTQVAYLVNDQTIHCPKAAAEAAEAKHTQVQPVVAGVAFDCPTKAQAAADKLAEKMKDFGVTTASAKVSTGGCAKSAAGGCAKAGGCSKAAATAAASGDGKAATGGCGKHAEGAATAAAGEAKAATGGCGKHAEGAAATASAEKGGCSGEGCLMTVGEDDTPALANAKKMVRQMVEFVVAAQQAPAQS